MRNLKIRVTPFNSPSVQFHNVSFLRKGVPILRGINFSLLNPGEHLLCLGPNGSGKSTILSLIYGTLWPTEGTIFLFGQSVTGQERKLLNLRIGLFQPSLQEQVISYHSHLTALDIILTGRDASLVPYSHYSSEDYKIAESMFHEFVGDESNSSFPLDRSFRLLSSGERRKVLLCRALVNNPDLMILDEPYESLDIPSRFSLEKLIHKRVLIQNNLMSFTVVHRIEEIPEWCNQAILIHKGQVDTIGPIKTAVTSETLSRIYSTKLQLIEHQHRRFVVPGK